VATEPQVTNAPCYSRVRNPDRLDTYLTVSASSNTPLLTLITTSYCPSCRTISPLLQKLITSGVGEDQGGINCVSVEFDAPDNMTLGQRYMITSIPTLLSFDRRRTEVVNREVDVRKMADERWLEEWIKAEAARDGGGQGGSGSSSGLFGGLFGSWK
jgi:thiol-disulfide isomerase/thioredoxin